MVVLSIGEEAGSHASEEALGEPVVYVEGRHVAEVELGRLLSSDGRHYGVVEYGG